MQTTGRHANTTLPEVKAMYQTLTSRFRLPVWGLVALLAVSMLFLLPGLLQAQASDAIEYAENGTDAVATFTATDPEGKDITWSVTQDGTADFKITDGVLEFKSPPNYEAPGGGIANDSNEYTVTVVASAGTGVPEVRMVDREVNVNVTNVEEAGSIVLSTLQPQVEIPITAALSDPDNPGQALTELMDLTWEWLRGEDVIAGATGATYTPMVTDVGSVLTARASYEDAEGEDKTAEIESAHAVRAKPDTNTPPAFPDQDPGVPANQQTRMVAENTPAGEDIGAPVEATDAGDVLTYSADNDNNPATEFTTFDIDRATGQLKTKASLDTEDAATQSVVVTATDPFGASATVTVTVTVTDVDEAPSIPSTAASTHTIAENETTRTLGVAYTATDPEGDTPTWSVSGPDSGKFTIPEGQLTFRSSPDFEAPGDAGGDNVYEVTVVASDSARNSDELDVRVTVTNVLETGTITFSSLRPKAGIPLTASLTDPDGGVTDLEWAWSRSVADFDEDDRPMSATYTPVMADIDRTLTATATYRDNSLAADDADIPLAQPHSASVVADTDNKAPVFEDQDTETDGQQTDQERMVAENTASATTIGDAVDAEVDNTMTSGGTDVPDVLTYSLGGTDAASFSIARNTGQLSTKAALDYETKQSYSVTVTATDPGNLSATVNVTIKVTDVNEDPELTGEAPAEYAENGMTPVTTFRATDPEGEDIVWTLAGSDREDFTIVGGVLRFANSPNFEARADANTDNNYEFTVNASDGTNSATEDVTLEVTNVEEPGVVTLSSLQPQVEVGLTATLDDPDAGGTTGSPTWMWLRGGSIIVGATSATYEPVIGDVGSVLTAKATYRDAEDADTDKTAQGRSSRSVRRVPTGGTSAPAFPDQNPSTLDVETAQTRMVAENTPSGRNIGAPVTASDPGDVLTYSLSGTDAGLFDLNRATGQLRTKEALNREASGGESHTVTVTATDPGGETDTSEVTITVTNVDEDPSITTTGSALRGISFAEDDAIATALADYAATEPESQDMTWSLSGDDAARFNIGNQDGGTPSVLTFKAQPDFEDPADADKDNVYEVTVVVSDPAGNSDEVDVRVTVTNVAETGTITFSSLQPKAGIALTAELDDPDSGVTGLMWQWENGGNVIEDATSATYTPVSDDIGDTLTVTATYRDGWLAADAEPITLESAVTATVVADTDNKAPQFMDQDPEMDGRQTDQKRSVPENYESGGTYGDPTVTYPNIGAAVTADLDNTLAPSGTETADTLTYSLGGADAASFDIDRADGQLEAKAALDFEDKDTYLVTVTATDPGGLSATVNVTVKVLDVDEAPSIRRVKNQPPMFASETTTRAVAENTVAGEDIGAPVMATDAVDDALTYTLSGADAASFDIDGDTGQLMTKAALDFETKVSYAVEVTATDGAGESDAIMVTITVTNMNEAPAFAAETAERSVAENTVADMAIGARVMATDADDEALTYALSGADAASFEIDADTGQLMTLAALDYETTTSYSVTVTATDAAGLSASIAVAITVTDVDEVADPLLAEYDPNGDGVIEKADMRLAVADFFGPSPTLSRADMRRLVGIYFAQP